MTKHLLVQYRFKNTTDGIAGNVCSNDNKKQCTFRYVHTVNVQNLYGRRTKTNYGCIVCAFIKINCVHTQIKCGIQQIQIFTAVDWALGTCTPDRLCLQIRSISNMYLLYKWKFNAASVSD